MPRCDQPDDAPGAQLPFLTLWYRFLFFDWMFRDLNAARNLYERNAAGQHNRTMSRYLPTYLRRWSFLTLAGFALGCLFEHATRGSMLSAWFFTSACVTLTGMVVISVAWALLAKSGTP
ncbi:hypothetical protein [Massilia sp. TSP1-1-2]|uniref:hypothetical protein n=1 Tax=unclassified Massilia TaxID=2609279 RepID=UPI003CFAF2BF